MTEAEFKGLKAGANVFRVYMQGPVICKVAEVKEETARIYEVVPVKNGFIGNIDQKNYTRWFLTMVEALEYEIGDLDRILEDKTLDEELRQKFLESKRRNEALLKRAREKAQEKLG